MDSIAQLVSLFPYVDLWRIHGKPNLNNRVSIIVSIILIVAIGSIAISKLVEVSKMSTIFASQQSQMNMQALMTTITTSYSDENMKQFMFAMYIDQSVSKEPRLSRSDYTIYGSHVQQNFNQENGNYDTKSQTFQLQSCTSYHFLNVPDIKQNYYSWNIDDWLCLPMNKSFQIGGIAISNYKYMQVGISCLTSNCRNRTVNGLLVRGYVLNTFVNPTNHTQPFRSFIYKYQSSLEPLSQSSKYFYINKNSLITDNSLLPFQSLHTQNSMDTYPDVIANQMSTSQGCSVSFIISHSGTTMKYKRSYLKILDALSYIGGIFNALLGAFFFMNTFGKFFFEIEFASLLFNNKELKKNSLWTAIKHMCYKAMVYIGKQPNWDKQKRFQNLKKTVNNLLDIIYLQRRLQFLQRAVEVMFDKHHLKGIYLTYNPTSEDADRRYTDHQFKANFLDYFNKKEDQATQRQTEQNHSNKRKGLQINLFSTHKSKQTGSQKTNIEAPDSGLRMQTQHSLQIDLKVQKNRIHRNAGIINKGIKKAEDITYMKDSDQNQEQKNQQQSKRQEDIKCILRLYREAKQNSQDQRSKRIFQKIENEIKQKIEKLAINYQIHH